MVLACQRVNTRVFGSFDISGHSCVTVSPQLPVFELADTLIPSLLEDFRLNIFVASFVDMIYMLLV